MSAGKPWNRRHPLPGNWRAYHVQAILDYGVEGGNNGEAGFDQACEEFIRVINYAASQPNIPYMSIKMTGIARFELLEKLDHSLDQSPGSLMKRYAAALATFTEDRNSRMGTGPRPHEKNLRTGFCKKYRRAGGC